MSNPDFLCIGMQKGGTTWLYSTLKDHPEIETLPAKELVFYNSIYIPSHAEWPLAHRRRQSLDSLRIELNQSDNNALCANKGFFERLDWHNKFCQKSVDTEWYRSLFEFGDQQKKKGDFSPDYIMLPREGINDISKSLEGVKIIFSVRNPVERAWSHLKMIARNENKDLDDLRWVESALNREDVKRRGYFKKDMENWQEVFGENFLYFKFPYIEENSLDILEKVSTHIGITFKPDLFPSHKTKVYQGQEGEIPERVYSMLNELYLDEVSFYNNLPSISN